MSVAEEIQTLTTSVDVAVVEVRAARDRLNTAVDEVVGYSEVAARAADLAVSVGSQANVYPSVSAGLSATAAGAQFIVMSGNDEVRYLHEEGGTATEVSRRPNGGAIIAAAAVADAKADQATGAATSAGVDAEFANESRVQSGLSEGAAALSAAQAALYDGPRRITVQQLLLDEALTYEAGEPSTVSAGKSVRVDLSGYSYEVAEEDADDYDLITAGGVRLYVSIGATVEPEAFGALGDGSTDDTATFTKACIRAAEYAVPLVATRAYVASNIDLRAVTGRIEIVVDGTLKHRAASTTSMIRIKDAANVVIRGKGVIDGNFSAQTTQAVASIQIDSDVATRLKVDGVRFINSNYRGLWVMGNNYRSIRVTDCRFTDGALGTGTSAVTYFAYIQSAVTAVFDGCIFEQTRVSPENECRNPGGIMQIGNGLCNLFAVRNCKFYNCGCWIDGSNIGAIDNYHFCKMLRIENVEFERSGHNPIKITNAGSVVIDGFKIVQEHAFIKDGGGSVGTGCSLISVGVADRSVYPNDKVPNYTVSIRNGVILNDGAATSAIHISSGATDQAFAFHLAKIENVVMRNANNTRSAIYIISVAHTKIDNCEWYGWRHDVEASNFDNYTALAGKDFCTLHISGGSMSGTRAGFATGGAALSNLCVTLDGVAFQEGNARPFIVDNGVRSLALIACHLGSNGAGTLPPSPNEPCAKVLMRDCTNKAASPSYPTNYTRSTYYRFRDNERLADAASA